MFGSSAAGNVTRVDRQDAYGQAMLDYFRRGSGWEIVERGDGVVSVAPGPAMYFAEFRRWHPVERRAMRFVRGSVLDIGCGAGRAIVHLRRRGLDVVGVDSSPGAVEVCRLRGLASVRRLAIDQLDDRIGSFDTVLMLGGGFGLLGNPDRGRRLLARLHRLTTDRGRIIAASRDPLAGDDPDEVVEARLNRAAGRISGQTRVRIRYRHFRTPYFDFFRCAPHEMRSLLTDTGWGLERVLEAGQGEPYVGVLEKAS